MNIIKNLFTFASAFAAMTTVNAQNPIIHNQFTADPTARVFNGRLYLFPSHDIISPVEPERKWFCMADYHMFSSNDLVEWTDNGMILSQEQVPWGNPAAFSMWAPDCVFVPNKDNMRNGKYYFYFPDAPKEGRGFGVGVAVADNLFQPKFVPQESNIKGISGIDPCVLQASDGNSYIFWGGGGLRVAKLKENMIELADDNPVETMKMGDREIKSIGVSCDKTLPKGFKEGPFAFERNGKFYLTYPWVRKEKGDPDGKGGTIDNPTECLAYAMSDNPMGPYEYKGIIMAEHENGCWTNHHSIVEFKGQWYLFYHHNDYSPSFDKNRSTCIDYLYFNEDGTIQEVKPTKRGVGISDTRKPVQVDRYSDIGGGATIEYHDTLNYFLGWKTVLPKKGWVKYDRVDTKSSSAQNVCVKVKTTAVGKLTLSLGSYTADVAVPNTKGEWQEVDVTVSTMPSGVNDLKLTNSGASEVEVDWITLTESPREKYFNKADVNTKYSPDEEGFIRSWWLREPLDKPNRSNTVFVDSYLRENLTAPAMTPSGADWHALESNRFNVKLFRFASGMEKQVYGVIFHAITVIECAEDINDVRLAVGSNSASRWWLNDDEVLMLSGDRRMVRDDAVSARINLKKGRNVLRGAVINGPGMSDFCVRFIDEKGEPVKNCKITLK